MSRIEAIETNWLLRLVILMTFCSLQSICLPSLCFSMARCCQTGNANGSNPMDLLASSSLLRSWCYVLHCTQYGTNSVAHNSMRFYAMARRVNVGARKLGGQARANLSSFFLFNPTSKSSSTSFHLSKASMKRGMMRERESKFIRKNRTT